MIEASMSNKFGTVIFELAEDDRNLLIEALGSHAMRYDEARADRCAELAATLEAAKPQNVSLLDATERAIVRNALQSVLVKGRAERHAAELLEARLHADDIANAILRDEDDDPPTERRVRMPSTIPPARHGVTQ